MSYNHLDFLMSLTKPNDFIINISLCIKGIIVLIFLLQKLNIDTSIIQHMARI